MKKKYIAILVIVGGIFYSLYHSLITDLLLMNGKTMCTKAIIEERITGKTSYPVLRYRFYYQGQTYIGFASETLGLDISDTINIVFLESNPSMNRPLNEMENY